MKNPLNHIIAICLLCFAILSQGCSTSSTPYERGQDAALAVLVIVPQDDYEEVEKVRDDIIAFLSSGETITEALIETYSDKLAKKINRNPKAVKAVVYRLTREMKEIDGEQRAREFLQGFADSL